MCYTYYGTNYDLTSMKVLIVRSVRIANGRMNARAPSIEWRMHVHAMG